MVVILVERFKAFSYFLLIIIILLFLLSALGLKGYWSYINILLLLQLNLSTTSTLGQKRVAIDCREVDVEGRLKQVCIDCLPKKMFVVERSPLVQVGLYYYCSFECFRVDGRKRFAYDTFGGETEKKSYFQKYPDTRGWGLKRFYLVVAAYFFVRLPIVQFSAAASVKHSSKIFQI